MHLAYGESKAMTEKDLSFTSWNWTGGPLKVVKVNP